MKRILIIATLLTFFGFVTNALYDYESSLIRAISLSSPLQYFKGRQPVNTQLYTPILATGGRSTKNIESLDATLLEIPSKYLVSKGQENDNGVMTLSLRIAVMKPDFEPAKAWRRMKGDELRKIFPDEKELLKKSPIKAKVSSPAWSEYRSIVEEYDDRVVRISLSSVRDIYSIQESYEGYLDESIRKELADKREYFGLLGKLEGRPLLNSDLNGVPISYKVGKYGEGLWKYKRGLGRDYIKEQSDPDYELWEYAEYSPIGSLIPNRFFYVPVIPEQPHQLYIRCGWNGNIDYLKTTQCSAESFYDNTIRYAFSFRRDNLAEYKKLNERVKKFINSLVLEKGKFSDIVILRNKKFKRIEPN